MDAAWSDVDKFLTGKTIDTSLGIRFESWKAAYYMVAEHPLFGVGLGRFQQEATVLVDNGRVIKGADDFNHTHNDFVYQMAVNGLVGLAILISIFVFPLYVFYKNVSSYDQEIKALSIAGLCLIAAFMQ